MELQTIKNNYLTMNSRAVTLAEQIKQHEYELGALSEEEDQINQAYTFLQVVADEAQNEIKADVDGLVTMAVQSIFGNDYTFDLQIDRTNTSAPYKPIVWETVDGVATQYTPKDEMGGSMVDPIAFIFRVVLRSLKIEPSRNTFWLDEPMKNMGKGELLISAADMLREVSHSLGLQLIIITHEDELAWRADRAWRLTRPWGRTQVQPLKKGTLDNPTKPKQKRRLR